MLAVRGLRAVAGLALRAGEDIAHALHETAGAIEDASGEGPRAHVAVKMADDALRRIAALEQRADRFLVRVEIPSMDGEIPLTAKPLGSHVFVYDLSDAEARRMGLDPVEAGYKRRA